MTYIYLKVRQSQKTNRARLVPTKERVHSLIALFLLPVIIRTMGTGSKRP